MIKKAGRLLLYLFLFFIPLETLLVLPIYGTMAKFTGVLLFGVFILSWINQNNKIKYTREFFWMFIYFIWVLVGYIWVIDIDLYIQRGITLMQLIAMCFVIYNIVETERIMDSSFYAYLMGVGLGIFFVIKDYLNNVSRYSIEIGRYSMEGYDPNYLAITIVIGISLATYLVEINKNKINQYGLYSFQALCIYAVVLTGSRTGLVSIVVALLLSVVMGTKTHKAKAVYIIFMTCVILFIINNIPETIYERMCSIKFQLLHGSMAQRRDIWDEVLCLIKDKPMTGYGYGNLISVMWQKYNIAKQAHNTYLSLIAETGVIGAILLIMVILKPSISVFCNTNRKHAMLLALIISVMAIGFSTLTMEYSKVTWIAIAILIIIRRRGCKNAFNIT